MKKLPVTQINSLIGRKFEYMTKEITINAW
jgi:hypothetical protein